MNDIQLDDLQRLLHIMAQLRDPETGCPWDIKQDFASIAPYTLEEAYEVVDAIDRGNYDELKDELGDLLLQVVFHAQMAAEQGLFTFADVAAAISDKMVRRHPHVFADASYASAAEQSAAWEQIKALERTQRQQQDHQSILADVPVALSALTRAYKLQRKAAQVGFDWSALAPVIDKIGEELQELRDLLPRGGNATASSSDVNELLNSENIEVARLNEELGDLLFACVNLARHLKIDPETALRQGNLKFERRFQYIEQTLQQRGQTPAQVELDELERLWQQAKQHD